MDKARHAFGSSTRISEALSKGLIDAFDILFLDGDTDSPKIGWIDRNGKIVVVPPAEDEVVVVGSLPQVGKVGVIYIVGEEAYLWTGAKFVPVSKTADFSELEAKVAAMETQVSDAEAKVSAVEEQVAAVEGKVSATESKVAEVESKVAEVEAKTSAVEGEVSAVKEQASAISEQVEAVETKVAAVEEQAATIGEQVSSVESQVAEVETTVSEVETKMSDVETQLEAKADAEEVEAKIDQVKSDAVADAVDAVSAYVEEKIETVIVERLANADEYAVAYKPEGTLVDYRDKEIRVMCPADTQWTLQQSGEGADANKYYIGFKAYAPSEDVVSFKEDMAEIIVDDTMYYFEGNDFAGVENGRKYSIVWLPVAAYDSASNAWTYYGANSSEEKYVGWYYAVEWYDSKGKIIASDCIRINLSNEECHSAIEPFYMSDIKADIKAEVKKYADELIEAKIEEVIEEVVDIPVVEF